MDIVYIEKLENIGLKVSNPDAPAAMHQELTCLLCDGKFLATPKSKINNYKKTKMKGCPNCTHKMKYAEVDKANEQRLIDMGYILLEDYKGLKEKILIINPTCTCGGTPWKALPANILQGVSFCAPCNTIRKSETLKQLNTHRHDKE